MVADRGLHNRGEFAKGLKANGVVIRQAALESPEMIGRGERHGGILKVKMEAVIKAHHVIGKKQMKQVAAISTENENDSMRKGGLTPSQWATGNYPRRPGSQSDAQLMKMNGGHLEFYKTSKTQPPSLDPGLRID